MFVARAVVGFSYSLGMLFESRLYDVSDLKESLLLFTFFP